MTVSPQYILLESIFRTVVFTQLYGFWRFGLPERFPHFLNRYTLVLSIFSASSMVHILRIPIHLVYISNIRFTISAAGLSGTRHFGSSGSLIYPYGMAVPTRSPRSYLLAGVTGVEVVEVVLNARKIADTVGTVHSIIDIIFDIAEAMVFGVFLQDHALVLNAVGFSLKHILLRETAIEGGY